MYCSGPVLNHYNYWPILGQSTRNLIIEGAMFDQDTLWKNIFFISSKDVMTVKNKIYLKFKFVNNYHLFPPRTALVGTRGWSNNQWWRKEGFKRYLPNFRADIMETELSLKLLSRIILDKPYNNQSFSYKNHCKHCKKVASRFRPMLFTITNFFLKYIYTLLFWRKIKICCDCYFSQ